MFPFQLAISLYSSFFSTGFSSLSIPLSIPLFISFIFSQAKVASPQSHHKNMNRSQSRNSGPGPIRKSFFRRPQSIYQLKNPLCYVCRTLDFRPDALSSPSKNNKNIILGTYDDLLQRTSCQFCQLVLHLVRRKEETVDLCIVDHDGPSKRTETKYELRKFGDAFEIYDGSSIQGYIHPATGDASSVPPATSSKFSESLLDIGRIRSWISECELKHVNCGIMEDSLVNREPLEILLVDVQNNCLVKATTSQQYVALSYVRGNIRMFHTTKSNYKALRKDGALDPQKTKLPKAISDAMRLVAMLGERYLWVDCLSIVQDDIMRKHVQLNNMNKIFGNAFLTIISASAADANTRLHGVEPGTRFPYVVAETIQGTHFISRPANIRALLDQGSYGSLAWKYQERLLSRRCLVLTAHQTYFLCLSSVHTDATSCKPDANHPELDVPSNPLAGIQLRRTLKAKTSPDIFSRGGFLLYDELVHAFTKRALTHPEERLSAFAGIGAVLKESYGSAFLSGLPESLFDLALLWVSATDDNPTTPSPPRSPHFPSWSWASQPGPIAHATGPLASALERGSPGLQVETGPIYLHKPHSFRPVERRYGALLQPPRDSTTSSSTAAACLPSLSPPPPPPLARRSPATLYFSACTARLEQFGLRAYDWAAGAARMLVYAMPSGRCCGKLWPDAGSGGELAASAAASTSASASPPALASVPVPASVPGSAPASASASASPPADGTREMVLLSRAHVESVARYMDLGYHFAADAFPDTEWGLLNVMVVEWRGGVAERLGVGQIHVGAWEAVEKERKVVVLG